MTYNFMLTKVPILVDNIHAAAAGNKKLGANFMQPCINTGATFLYLDLTGCTGGTAVIQKYDRVGTQEEFMWALQNYPDTSWIDPSWQFPTAAPAATTGTIVAQTAGPWNIYSHLGYELTSPTDHDCLQHVVSYGTRRGFCRKCDRDLQMDDITMEWRKV